MALAEPTYEDEQLSARDAQLEPFRAMNARAAATGKAIPWEERLAMIRRQWPSNRPDFNWAHALMDVDLLARIFRDILKLDSRPPGRIGPRPPLTEEEGMASWRRLTGQDYSTLPFPATFHALIHVGGRRISISHVARKTGLPRSRCHRLLHADIEPTAEDMRAVAAGFGKHPSYFSEYRAAFVTAQIAERLAHTPDVSIRMYQQMREADQ